MIETIGLIGLISLKTIGLIGLIRLIGLIGTIGAIGLISGCHCIILPAPDAATSYWTGQGAFEFLISVIEYMSEENLWDFLTD